jgi:hypothetical protein
MPASLNLIVSVQSDLAVELRGGNAEDIINGTGIGRH